MASNKATMRNVGQAMALLDRFSGRGNAGFNIGNPPMEVRHAELEPADDGLFKSMCPVCGEGTLLVMRDQKSLELLDTDRCILCGQTYIYLDIEEMKKPGYKRKKFAMYESKVKRDAFVPQPDYRNAGSGAETSKRPWFGSPTQNNEPPVILVLHANLERVNNDPLISLCPKCQTGWLQVQKNGFTQRLVETDKCTLCGQKFVYQDIEEMRKPGYVRGKSVITAGGAPLNPQIGDVWINQGTKETLIWIGDMWATAGKPSSMQPEQPQPQPQPQKLGELGDRKLTLDDQETQKPD